MHNIMLRIRFLVPFLILLLHGCASLTQDETANWTAEEFYNEAKDELNSGNYESAIDLFSKLEARYPYGRYAQQAQLETAYAHFKADEPDAAIAAADRFIKLHPRHPNVDYAYYMRGLASFSGAKNFLERFLPQDPSERDPALARESFQYFKELVTRFPDSRYTPDAIERMTYLRNNLAQHEVNIGNYYFERGAYLAANKRAQYVVENYQQTPAIPYALGLMIKAYRAMGLNDLANDSLRVLVQNYPDHPVVTELLQQPADNDSTTKE